MIANRNAALLLAMLAGGTAHAADRMVTLTRPLPLVQDMAAVPRIADPRDAAERRINAGADGTRTVSLDSPELRQRFLAAQQSQADPRDAAQCARVLA